MRNSESSGVRSKRRPASSMSRVRSAPGSSCSCSSIHFTACLMGASPALMALPSSLGLQVADDPPGAVHVPLEDVEGVVHRGLAALPAVEGEAGEGDVVGEREVPVELPGHLD